MRVEDIHAYWKNPDDANSPTKYATDNPAKSKALVNIVRRLHIPLDAPIMELGCNVGRNLYYMQEAGFSNLSGIELSIHAVEAMHEHYPSLCAAVHVSSIEDSIKHLGHFELIFSMAVLEHIHPKSEWIFPEIAERCKFLITIEDEIGKGPRHFPRNYRHIFEPPGFLQLRAFKNIPSMPTGFRARVFVKEV